MRTLILFVLFLITNIYGKEIYTLEVGYFSQDLDEKFVTRFSNALTEQFILTDRIEIAESGNNKNRKGMEFPAIPTRNILISIYLEDANIKFEIKFIDLENGFLLNTFSKNVDLKYRNRPVYCAKLVSEYILKNIPVIANIIDIQGNNYVIDAGSKKEIELGDAFNIYPPNIKNYSESRKICTMRVVALDQEKSYLQLDNPIDYQLEYGFIAVLEMVPKASRDNCNDLFIPPILKTSYPFTLSIQSQPEGAKVLLNGCSRNWVTPVEISNLKRSKIQLVLMKKGFNRYAEVIFPRGKNKIVKRIILTEKNPERLLSVFSEPAGAKVMINGIEKGTTPLNDISIQNEQIQVEVTLYGYLPKISLIRIEKGEHKEYKVQLKRDPAIIRQENCVSMKAKRFLRMAIQRISVDDFSGALRQLRKAYRIEPSCGTIFYWKGIIEWIEFDDREKARISLKKAQKNGFIFDDMTPHPIALTPEKYSQLISYFRKLVQN